MTDWTFAAQNVLTGEWHDFDLPFIRDQEQPKFELSGAGSLTGKVSGDHPTLRDGAGGTVLAEWQTVLHVIADGDLAGSFLVHQSTFNGAEWEVTAYGYTSYATGIPYTGDYQKFVDSDPGVIWSALWSHLQSQPDGNLGLRHVIPRELGPNIGTKEEPYELSWWEAKDVGSELQQLASEAPFDYVESHEWDGLAPQVDGGVLLAGGGQSFTFGTGNFEGGYTGTDRGGWMKKRADAQAAWVPTLGIDMLVATELHEDTSSAMPKGADAYWLGLLRKHGGPDWTITRGYRGNQLIHKASVVKVWATENQRVKDPTGLGSELRAASAWYVTHLPTGLTGWAFAGHFRVDQSDGVNLEPVRRAEASNLAAWANAHATKPAGLPPDVPEPMFHIIAGDFNSADHDKNAPMWLFEQAGYYDLKARASRAGLTVPYASQASGKGGLSGRWIDNVLTKTTEVDVSDVRGIPTLKLTDHHLWVAGRITPRVSLAVAAASLTGGLPKVRHTVTLSYPRAGRRRADLKLVQGDNVLEVVPVTRDGETFSNDVVVLGKGEGKKTLRGEDVVRDGRLRRPFLYTDKLAATTARCNALAKRERGWRSLAPQVESILVADHPNAPMGSWQLGDDVLLEAYDVPHLGEVVDWYRIMAWAPVTDSTARLYVTRADAFTYGPTTLPPSDDDQGEDPDSDVDEGVGP